MKLNIFPVLNYKCQYIISEIFHNDPTLFISLIKNFLLRITPHNYEFCKFRGKILVNLNLLRFKSETENSFVRSSKTCFYRAISPWWTRLSWNSIKNWINGISSVGCLQKWIARKIDRRNEILQSVGFNLCFPLMLKVQSLSVTFDDMCN